MNFIAKLDVISLKFLKFLTKEKMMNKNVYLLFVNLMKIVQKKLKEKILKQKSIKSVVMEKVLEKRL